MWCYKDGVVVVDTPVVTGNVSKGYDTPSGSVWAIDAKKHDAVLKGEGYTQPVTYWMPFNGNVGIHDADTWRSEYGGEIYKTSGSHGYGRDWNTGNRVLKRRKQWLKQKLRK